MNFSSRFGQGSIIGVHLDTWHGTLTFFKNRKCIGESCCHHTSSSIFHCVAAQWAYLDLDHKDRCNVSVLPPGVAATELRNKRFYPMACSTAAKSSMKVIRSCSAPTSLLYLCCARLRQLAPDSIDVLDVVPLPPGLRQLLHNKLGWVLSLNSSSAEETAADGTEHPDQSQLPVQAVAGPSSPESDSEGCASDPEACQRKRCRWMWPPLKQTLFSSGI